ncbi:MULTISPECIES: outer membrane beta-barrel protein [Proteiniphilum]|jgi:hypothetical protein|uniref:outer membrane beta-barrel protein n=1 Tax=Proteiniphilum TaxID=294702 RepID=UPI001EEADA45|nr:MULTISPECIES: outer membrane beta-barrel protein [Proteiniphilum]ULB35349.1 outer membrane beta-barrel protein [Proteiniphilum propionicum]
MKPKNIIHNSLTVILLSMMNLPVFSQIRFGVKADVGLNNPNFSTSALKVENMTSYSIGPSFEAMLLPLATAKLGIDASLVYNDNRMTVSNLTGTNEVKDISNRYLMMPVNAKLKFGAGLLPIRLFAAAGPYAGYLIHGDKINIEETADNIKAKGFCAGTNIALGVEVLRMIQVGVNYRVQLTDNYSLDKPNWRDPLNGKTNSWNITGSIYF